MAILPVSSIKLDTNNIPSFRGDMEVEPKREPNRVSGVRKLATVPVVVLMTLNPSLSAQAAGSNAPEPKQITMEMPYAAPTHSESAEPMYDFAAEAAALAEAPESAPQTSRVNAPNAWYNTERIVERFPFVSDGKKYTMLYTTLKSNNKEITSVYFIPEGYDKFADENLEPPMFKKLIYHNLGKVEDNFAGAWTSEEAILGGIPTTIYREIKLPDEITGKLVDMLSGDYNMPPNKYIRENCIEEVFDSKLRPTKYSQNFY